jgi:phosphatidylglycerol---prolipoprotein diacylglyceryl transferase
VHPVLIGPLHTFGVMVLLGVLAGLWWIRHDAPRLRLDPEDTASLTVEIFLAGLIGSRIMFVMQNWEAYAENGWWNVFAIWKGGLVWYGGLLAALPAAVWRMRRYGFPVLRTCDLITPGTMLGLGIGRIGCLMAGDDHGRMIIEESKRQAFTTSLPGELLAGTYGGQWQQKALQLGGPEAAGAWLAQHDPFFVDQIPWYALTFNDPEALVGPGYRGVPLLPSQPLMTLGCMTLFVILVLLRKPLTRAPGTLTALLFVLYPIERYLVEMSRGDMVRGHLPEGIPLIGGMSTSQAISAIILPVGVIAGAIMFVRGRAEWDRLVKEGKDPLAIDTPITISAPPEKSPDAPAPAPAPAPEPPKSDAPAP